MISHSMVAGVLGLALVTVVRASDADAWPRQPLEPPRRVRDILVFDACIGAPPPAIAAADAALAALAECAGAFRVTFTNDPAVLTPDGLRPWAAVVWNTGPGWALPDAAPLRALLRRVESGAGLVVLGGSDDVFRAAPDVASALGPICHATPVPGTAEAVAEETNHRLNEAWGATRLPMSGNLPVPDDDLVRDRVRVLLRLHAADTDTLAALRPDADVPVAWIRRVGRGRLYRLTLSDPAQWRNPALACHLLGGIQYAAGDVRVEERPSASVSGLAAWIPPAALSASGESSKPLAVLAERCWESPERPRSAVKADLWAAFRRPEAGPAFRRAVLGLLIPWAGREDLPVIRPWAESDSLGADIRRFVAAIPAESADAFLLAVRAGTNTLARADALEWLAVRRAISAVPPLLRELDGRPGDAPAILRALGEIASPAAADALAALPPGDPPAPLLQARLRAADLRREAGDAPRALRLVRAVLAAPAASPAIRAAALARLWRLDAAGSVHDWLQAATGSEPAVRQAAFDWLDAAEAAAAVVDAAADRFPELPADAQARVLRRLTALRAEDPRVRALWLAALDRPRADIRAVALEALARAGRAAEAARVFNLVMDDRSREEALDCLRRMPDPAVGELLLARLEHPDPAFRRAAIRSLAARRPEGSRAALLRGAEDRDTDVRREAYRALGDTGGEDEFAGLLWALARETDDTARRDGLAALAACGGRLADGARARALREALPSLPAGTRLEALRLTEPWRDGGLLGIVVEGVRDPDSAVREEAQRQLADWPTVEALPPVLVQTREAETEPQRIRAVLGALRLIGAAEGWSPAERVARYKELFPAAHRADERRRILDAVRALPGSEAEAFLRDHAED